MTGETKRGLALLYGLLAPTLLCWVAGMPLAQAAAVGFAITTVCAWLIVARDDG